MSNTESATRKKKAPADASKRAPEDDHRRKRRNRMTQSCLNCHTSKRMCDRKRPCGRCTQLGLTGLCVYEVDDPSQRNDVPDEQLRLQKRVAELESVIRELKNKPHPRWAAQPPSIRTDSDQPIAVSSSSSQEPSSPVNTHTPPPTTPAIRLHPAEGSSSSSVHDGLLSSPLSSHSRSSGSLSPIQTPPSPLSLTPADGTSLQGSLSPGCDLNSLLSPYFSDTPGLNGLLDGLMGCDGTPLADSCCSNGHGHDVAGHCGCLQDSKSYGVILELSLRLRRAADILANSPKHLNANGNCSIYRRISAMDKFTTETLTNLNAPMPSFSSYPHEQPVPTVGPNCPFPYHSRAGSQQSLPAINTISPQALQGVRNWDYRSSSYPSPPCEDSFMSWEPSSRRPEWPQQGPR
ncbi:hypothetical protein K474DRAFT_1609180 [Panus rudis PR-1116 ss-1]|nr:hypothetical protein K474DRAFT_1609180 [Panus rudis PR-1116 ss-1]